MQFIFHIQQPKNHDTSLCGQILAFTQSKLPEGQIFFPPSWLCIVCYVLLRIAGRSIIDTWPPLWPYLGAEAVSFTYCQCSVSMPLKAIEVVQWFSSSVCSVPSPARAIAICFLDDNCCLQAPMGRIMWFLLHHYPYPHLSLIPSRIK